MLQSIKQLYGQQLAATDGDIGHVKDFYFDARTWAVRYVLADTGAWMQVRKVLLSPHAFGSLHLGGKLLLINLTLQQIEGSPSIALHTPISRRIENELYRYYGWASYWHGEELWGMSHFPHLNPTTSPGAEGVVSTSDAQLEGVGGHLRSLRALDGYHLKATDGIQGHVNDFMMEAQSWAVPQMVVKTGHWITGREVEVPTTAVKDINYNDSKILVSLTSDAVARCPPHHATPLVDAF